ncbi:MAG: hypothetical protein ACI4YB_07535 [Oscillospiraceae bacterium]
MKIKSVIALLAAVSFLTACGKVSETSGLDKAESSTPNVGTITSVANIPSNETTVKVSEKTEKSTDINGVAYGNYNETPITSEANNETMTEASETNTVSENSDTPTLWEHIEIEPQCGPSIGFSFELPDGWSYEAVQTDDEATSCISVYIKPNTESNGFITIEYTRGGIGVCGTNLNEESIDFNGHSAIKGTYDSLENWSFIFLNDDYDGCAVFNNAGEWYDKYEDDIELILSTVEFKLYE